MAADTIMEIRITYDDDRLWPSLRDGKGHRAKLSSSPSTKSDKAVFSARSFLMSSVLLAV